MQDQNSPAAAIKEATVWLENFQNTPEAWSICDQVELWANDDEVVSPTNFDRVSSYIRPTMSMQLFLQALAYAVRWRYLILYDTSVDVDLLMPTLRFFV